LPLNDLMEIVLAMERQSATLLPRLRRNKQVFAGQLQLLRQRVAGAVEVPGVTNIGAVQKPIQEPIAKA
jgi:hypothetical protein